MSLILVSGGTSTEFSGGENITIGNGLEVKQIYARSGGSENLVWQHDVVAPTLVVNDIVGTSDAPSIIVGDTFVVSGTVSDEESGVDSVVVTLSNVRYPAVLVESGNEYTWQVTIPSPTENELQNISIVAKDNAGLTTTKEAYIYRVSATTVTIMNMASGDTTHNYWSYSKSFTIPRFAKKLTSGGIDQRYSGGSPEDCSYSVKANGKTVISYSGSGYGYGSARTVDISEYTKAGNISGSISANGNGSAGGDAAWQVKAVTVSYI